MALKEKEELKRLQSLRTKQKAEIDLIKREQSLINERLETANRGLKKIDDELSKVKNNGRIIVSEHAVLRYIERNLGIDVKEIESQIITESVIEQYKILGNGKYPIGDGLKAVIKDNVVLTVTD